MEETTEQSLVCVVRYLTESGREYYVLAPDRVAGLEVRIRGDFALSATLGDRIREVKNMLMPPEQYEEMKRYASVTNGPFPETIGEADAQEHGSGFA